MGLLEQRRRRPRRRDSPDKKTPSSIIDLSTIKDDDTLNGEQEIDKELLVWVDGIPITKKHEKILMNPNEWITDEIINAYCSRVTAACNDIHCCSTFFYTKISSRVLDTMWLERWKRTISFPKSKIFIPINWGNSHWALIVYDITTNVLQYYDSMMNSNHSNQALGIVKKAFMTCSLSSITKVGQPPNSCITTTTTTTAAATATTNANTNTNTNSNANTNANSNTPPCKDDNENVGVLAFIMSKMSISSKNGQLNPLCQDQREEEIKVETPLGQPQQTDGSSCGVFVCWWVAKLSGFLLLLPPPSFTHDNNSNSNSKGLRKETVFNPLLFRKAILDTIMGTF